MISMNGFLPPNGLSTLTALFLVAQCVSSATSALTEPAIGGNFKPQTLIRKVRSYASMNEAERKFCLNPVNARSCMSVRNHAREALAEAKRRFAGDSLHNGDGDAFRHCYWCARMTQDLGEGKAKGFGDRHEEVSQSALEKKMDLNNNGVGFLVGNRVRSSEAAAEECARLAKTGGLTIFDGKRVFPSGMGSSKPNIHPSSIGGPKIFPQRPENKPSVQNSNPQDSSTLLRISPDLPKIIPSGSQNKPNLPDNGPKVFRLGSSDAPTGHHTPISRPNLFPSPFQNRPIQHSPLSTPNLFPSLFQNIPIQHSPVSTPNLFPPLFQNRPIQHSPLFTPNLFPSSFQNRPIQHSPVSRPNLFPSGFLNGPIQHSPISRPSLFPSRFPTNPRFNFGG